MKPMRQLWLVGVFIVVRAQPLAAASSYELDWAKQIGTSMDDYVFDVAADSAGVYLVGTTFGDFAENNHGAGTTDGFIVRYDLVRNRLWGAHLGSEFSEDAGGVFANSDGGAYVTGSTGGHLGGANAGGTDLYLSRFDAAGNRLWLRQFGTSLNDSGTSIAADSAGSVFVGGFTFGELAAPNQGINRTDAILARYDEDGNRVWTLQWGLEGNDNTNAVALDGAGGVYAAGRISVLSGPNPSGADAFVRRHDRDGGLLWERRLSTEFADSAVGLAPDGHGGVYVSGNTQGSLFGTNPTPVINDPFLARIDGDGDLLWIRQLNLAGQDFGGEVATVPGGAIITGAVITALPGETSVGQYDAYIAYFNENGDLLWNDQFGSDKSDYGVAISADPTGGVFFGGYTWGSMFGSNLGGPYDGFMMRFIAVPEPPMLVLLCVSAMMLRAVYSLRFRPAMF